MTDKVGQRERERQWEPREAKEKGKEMQRPAKTTEGSRTKRP